MVYLVYIQWWELWNSWPTKIWFCWHWWKNHQVNHRQNFVEGGSPRIQSTFLWCWRTSIWRHKISDTKFALSKKLLNSKIWKPISLFRGKIYLHQCLHVYPQFAYTSSQLTDECSFIYFPSITVLPICGLNLTTCNFGHK